MLEFFKSLIQGLANKLGYHVLRRDSGVNVDCAFSEQLRLIGSGAKCIVEVGAADGRDTERYALSSPQAQVIAFEPLPESFKVLQQRLATCSSIQAFNVAVADSVGNEKFYVGKWADTSSLLKASSTNTNYDSYTSPTQAIDVNVVTLDSFCKENDIGQIDLLKMDAQGAELRILQGAVSLLKSSSIRIIYCEVNFLEIYTGSPLFEDISLFLRQHGFGLHGLYDIVRDHKGRMLWADAIYCHHDS
jgi:FkbM family methyltransferase